MHLPQLTPAVRAAQPNDNQMRQLNAAVKTQQELAKCLELWSWFAAMFPEEEVVCRVLAHLDGKFEPNIPEDPSRRNRRNQVQEPDSEDADLEDRLRDGGLTAPVPSTAYPSPAHDQSEPRYAVDPSPLTPLEMRPLLPVGRLPDLQLGPNRGLVVFGDAPTWSPTDVAEVFRSSRQLGPVGCCSVPFQSNRSSEIIPEAAPVLPDAHVERFETDGSASTLDSDDTVIPEKISTEGYSGPQATNLNTSISTFTHSNAPTWPRPGISVLRPPGNPSAKRDYGLVNDSTATPAELSAASIEPQANTSASLTPWTKIMTEEEGWVSLGDCASFPPYNIPSDESSMSNWNPELVSKDDSKEITNEEFKLSEPAEAISPTLERLPEVDTADAMAVDEEEQLYRRLTGVGLGITLVVTGGLFLFLGYIVRRK